MNRSLSELVAIHVFGLRFQEHSPDPERFWCRIGGGDKKTDLGWWVQPSGHAFCAACNSVEDYESDARFVPAILDKMREVPSFAEITLDDDGYTVTFTNEVPVEEGNPFAFVQYQAYSDSMCRAVCIAALRALGIVVGPLLRDCEK